MIKYFLVLFVLCPVYVFSQNAQEIIKNVQDKYNSINDGKAGFYQNIKYSSGKSQSSSGVLYIQKENKYRIETNNQIIITNGEISWTYTPSKNQVIIDYYKDDGNSFSPNKYLFKYPENFYSDYSNDDIISGNECYVLKLTPRFKGSVKSAKIWVDKTENYIRKINIVTSESTITYTLKNIDFDIGLSSSKFNFSPPESSEIIDLR